MKILKILSIKSECYGPIYRNKAEIIAWYKDWNKNGQVLEWPIKNIWIANEIAFVEWYFKCNYKNRISEFDGVSIIKFDKENRIISVKEFQSNSTHVYPYKNITSTVA
ncbi:nuclear transport factor 2 family protein [Lactobacillus johnsonii]|uniref:Nuclear transport factor 2 family protein n=1 Tax=Lactobacillus johnsonii TaxID=33959 RepID=A0AAW5M1K0_LACJH|nr:nuclear transport factor 2 family protein [Lactobacillus johnsonii]MCR1914205.1 nuclear transport factor 2 family protein [Lactobacillus johnsonii]